MQKKIVCLLPIFFITLIQAQVVVNVQLPATGVTMKSQLWNLSLINSSNSEKDVQIEMTFTDASNNQRVMTALTNIFRLPKGMKQIVISDILPVIYTANSSGYNIDNRPEGFLPIGSFIVCYSVIHKLNDATENLGDECERIDIEPLSPPMLVSPAEDEQIEITRPVFNWLSPSPPNFFNQLLYDWTLVEVKPTQSGSLAIQQNIPLLTQSGITTTNFQYPMSFPELDTGKIYAWQVAAKNNNSVIAKTEVWTFRIKQPEREKENSTGGYYVRLRKSDDAAFVMCNGVLKYEYVNELNDSLAYIQVTDLSISTRKEIPVDSSAVAIRFGQNFMQFDVRDLPGMTDKHIYLFELVNSRKEKWCLKFEYRRQN